MGRLQEFFNRKVFKPLLYKNQEENEHNNIKDNHNKENINNEIKENSNINNENKFLADLKEKTKVSDKTLPIIPIDTIENILNNDKSLKELIPDGENIDNYIYAILEYKNSLESLGIKFSKSKIERISLLTSREFKIEDNSKYEKVNNDKELLSIDNINLLIKDENFVNKFLNYDKNKEFFGNVSKDDVIESVRRYQAAVENSDTLIFSEKEQDMFYNLFFDRDLTHYGKKFDSTLELDSKFKEDILEDLPKCNSQTMLAHEIYKSLNKKVKYNQSFCAAPKEKKEEITNQLLSKPIDTFNISDNLVICKSWSEIYSKLLTDYSIDNVITKQGEHYYVTLLADNEVIKADATNVSKNMFDTTGKINDIERACFNMPTAGFTILSNKNKNVEFQKSEYEKVNNSKTNEDLAFLRREDDYDEHLADTLLNAPIKEKFDFLNEQFSKIENKDELDMLSYISYVKSKVFRKDSNLNECMIGIPVDDNNYKISKVYSYDLDNNVNYYYLSKDGFREISKDELKDKFSSGNFTKTSDNSFVPGIIEKDGTILKEHEESEVVI